MSKNESIQGGCLCGRIRYQSSGMPYKVSYCNCNTCRKSTGAPTIVWIMYDQGLVNFTKGAPRIYQSSPGVERGFCGVCGTPLWWQGQWDDKLISMVTVGSMDDPSIYPPDRHSECNNQIEWFEIADDHPRYPGATPKD